MRVLVLNTTLEPYDIWSWQKTMVKLLGSNSIYVIKNYDRRIRDGRGNLYDVPAVVVLKQYSKSKHKPAPYSKTNVYARDLNKCMYCGTTVTLNNRTLDHVVPRDTYVRNPHKYPFKLSSFENVVTSCKQCNLRKKNRTPEQANMTLIRHPKRITRMEVYRNKLIMNDVPLEWIDYI